MSQYHFCIDRCSKALVALGANQTSKLGAPAATINFALSYLRLSANTIVRSSHLYSTPCFPAGYGPDYVNAAAEISFKGGSSELLALLHSIEVIFGRVRGERWGKRVLDADLIAFGTQVLPDLYTYKKWRDLPISDQMLQTPDQLILPHPRLQDRAFVLRPLMDLVPDWIHPVSGLKIKEIYAQLPPKDRAEVKLILERA